MENTDWRQIPAPQREIFSIQDILGRTNHFLNVTVCSAIGFFALHVGKVQGEEFCRYFFYFGLEDKFKFRDTSGYEVNIVGLVMWMGRKNWREGELTVRFVIQERPFYHPVAAYRFPLMDPWRDDVSVTMLTLLNILRGNTLSLGDRDRTDLTTFKFWPLECSLLDDPGIRGHRDALTQWMIRWESKEYVLWNSYRQYIDTDAVLEIAGLDNWDLGSQPFDTIIGIGFTAEGVPRDLQPMTITMQPKKIRGGYWAIGYDRVLYIGLDRLPYETPPVPVTTTADNSAETWTYAEAHTQPEDLLTGSPRPRPATHESNFFEYLQMVESHSDSSGEFQLVTMCQRLGIESQPQSEHFDNLGDDEDYSDNQSSSDDSSDEGHYDEFMRYYLQG